MILLKIAGTIGYLGSLYLGRILDAISHLKIVSSFSVKKASSNLLGPLIHIVQFVQYFQFWVLTGFLTWEVVFPIVLGAIFSSAGNIFTKLFLKKRQNLSDERKIDDITSAFMLMWWYHLNVKNNKRGCINIILMYLGYFIGIIGSLIVYWSYPIGAPNAVFLISLFIFFIPFFSIIYIFLSLSWPINSNRFVNDELRLKHLIIGFSIFVNWIIVMIFPSWLFNIVLGEQFKEVVEQGHFFSACLLLPVFIFVLFFLIPFYTGSVRHFRERFRSLRWRENYITDLNDAIKNGLILETTFFLNKLKNEIEYCLSNIYGFYVYGLKTEDIHENLVENASSFLVGQIDLNPVTRLLGSYGVTESKIVIELIEYKEDIKVLDLRLNHLSELIKMNSIIKENFDNWKKANELLQESLPGLNEQYATLFLHRNDKIIVGIYFGFLIALLYGLLTFFQEVIEDKLSAIFIFN